ncbi:MAG: HEPN domain-containing protein [Prosthecobacter sp.]
MGVELYPTIQAWLIRARNDLANAEFTAQHRSDLLDTVVYHCQQAAEKVMKAFLVSEDISILKTHDVGKLVQLASANNACFATLQTIADAITPFATEFRYPADDEAPMPSAQQAAEALAAARRIYDFVLSVLPPETHPT